MQSLEAGLRADRGVEPAACSGAKRRQEGMAAFREKRRPSLGASGGVRTKQRARESGNDERRRAARRQLQRLLRRPAERRRSEMVEGGPIDVLTGDYLAELTMLILLKDKMPGTPSKPVMRVPFCRQLQDVAQDLLRHTTSRSWSTPAVFNPGGLADACRRRLYEAELLAAWKGRATSTVTIMLPIGSPSSRSRVKSPWRTWIKGTAAGGARARGAQCQCLSRRRGASVEALHRGADLVICPRVTDASVVVGPAAWRFGWSRTDWDQLAGAVVAGHIIECSAQATGGNYAFFHEIESLRRPGFPIAEMAADGSFVVTKHDGTDGEVNVGTVTSQLLYEIQGARYLNPDVVVRLDPVRVEQEGKDRVRVWGVRGEPAPTSSRSA